MVGLCRSVVMLRLVSVRCAREALPEGEAVSGESLRELGFEEMWLEPTQQAWRCSRCGRIEHADHGFEPLFDINRLALCVIHFEGHVWERVVLRVSVAS